MPKRHWPPHNSLIEPSLQQPGTLLPNKTYGVSRRCHLQLALRLNNSNMPNFGRSSTSSGRTEPTNTTHQSLWNVKYWNCHHQRLPQVVRTCHPNGIFKTSSDYPLELARQWQTTSWSPTAQIRIPTEVLPTSNRNQSQHLGNRTYRRSILAKGNSFRLSHREEEKNWIRSKRRKHKARHLQSRPSPALPGKLYPWLFHSRLGLQSHVKFKHRWTKFRH